MKFSEETKKDFERMRRNYERRCEQQWKDDLFEFQMRYDLSDKAMQELKEKL